MGCHIKDWLDKLWRNAGQKSRGGRGRFWHRTSISPLIIANRHWVPAFFFFQKSLNILLTLQALTLTKSLSQGSRPWEIKELFIQSPRELQVTGIVQTGYSPQVYSDMLFLFLEHSQKRFEAREPEGLAKGTNTCHPPPTQRLEGRWFSFFRFGFVFFVCCLFV